MESETKQISDWYKTLLGLIIKELLDYKLHYFLESNYLLSKFVSRFGYTDHGRREGFEIRFNFNNSSQAWDMQILEDLGFEGVRTVFAYEAITGDKGTVHILLLAPWINQLFDEVKGFIAEKAVKDFKDRLEAKLKEAEEDAR